MKQEISTLMDGEMYEDEAEIFFDRLRQHQEVQQDWETYHLIGDVLRQPDYLSANFSASFAKRLEDEPIVFAPQAQRPRRIRNFAVSVAASVMAIATVVWMSSQIGNEPAPQIVAKTVVKKQSVPVASTSADDYLMAHQEYSPSANIRGASFYINTASGE